MHREKIWQKKKKETHVVTGREKRNVEQVVLLPKDIFQMCRDFFLNTKHDLNILVVSSLYNHNYVHLLYIYMQKQLQVLPLLQKKKDLFFRSCSNG